MKNFETLEHLWRQQAVVGPADPQKIRLVQSATERVVKSRGRLLKWGIALTAFSFVVLPVLTVVNHVYGGRTPNLVALMNVGLLQLLEIGFLIVLVRRFRAYRRVRAQSARSVREGLGISLEMIEREIREYRIGIPLFVLALLFDTVPVFNGYHLGYYDGAGVLHRLIFVSGLGLLLLSTALRHYRHVLQPRRHELTEVLQELQSE